MPNLYDVVSGICAIIVLMVWLKPKLFDFLKDKGTDKPSLSRQGQYTALIVSTWAFVSLTVTNRLSEWFFWGYLAAFGAAHIASLYLKIKGQQPQEKP